MILRKKFKFKVPFNFEIYFGRNLLFSKDFIKSIFPVSKDIKTIFFVEDGIAILYPDLPQKIYNLFNEISTNYMPVPPLIRAGGEKNKSLDNAIEICKIISNHALCRHSIVAAIGGGAFLDTVCFAASISHRGIRQIRFPTTVVSQSDSGVGVKNAINLFGKKNFAGTFFPPYAVVNDFTFLETLPLREKIAGAAEAIKVAIIKDKKFFTQIENNTEKILNGDNKFFEKLITKTAILHSKHISKSGDPFEFGNSKPLDFGHWLAHKLESATNGKIRHGEAVSIGIAVDSFVAMKLNLITTQEFNRIIKVLQKCSLPIYTKILSEKASRKLNIIQGLSDFREHLGGQLSITMPQSIGAKTDVNELNETLIFEAFKYLERECKNA